MCWHRSGSTLALYVVWWNIAIIWSNVDLSLVRSSDIHPRQFHKKYIRTWINNISLKITFKSFKSPRRQWVNNRFNTPSHRNNPLCCSPHMVARTTWQITDQMPRYYIVIHHFDVFLMQQLAIQWKQWFNVPVYIYNAALDKVFNCNRIYHVIIL